MQKHFGSPIYLDELNVKNLQSAFDELKDHKPNAIFLLAVDQTSIPNSEIDTFLKDYPVPVFGGINPSIIVGAEVKKQGAIAVPIFSSIEYQIIEDMQDLSSELHTIDFDVEKAESLMIFVDGLNSRIDDSLNEVFHLLGNQIPTIGAGFGSLSFEQKCSVFTPKGCLKNAMLLIAFTHPCEVSIAHGWEILDGPFLANEIDANVLLGLNFQPAMDTYKEVVEVWDGRKFSDHDFFDIAQNHPFGIDRLDDDLLVRDPLTEQDGNITCVGKIPHNTMVYILKGEAEKLIHATTEAVREKCSTNKANSGIVFDCVSRELYLKERFSDELLGIASSFNKPHELFGALVMGEIASSANGAISLHNKTAVVGIYQ